MELELTVKERWLIERLREIYHGPVEIIIIDGKIDRIVKVKENIKAP